MSKPKHPCIATYDERHILTIIGFYEGNVIWRCSKCEQCYKEPVVCEEMKE